MIVATDLEGTLTTGKTWLALLPYHRTHGGLLRYTLFLISRFPGAVLTKAGLLSQEAYNRRLIEGELKAFKDRPYADIQEMGEWIVEHSLWPKRRLDVLAEIEAHRQHGHRVMIASGTMQPVV